MFAAAYDALPGMIARGGTLANATVASSFGTVRRLQVHTDVEPPDMSRADTGSCGPRDHRLADAGCDVHRGQSVLLALIGGIPGVGLAHTEIQNHRVACSERDHVIICVL
jgi:hypothetical protein